MWITARIKDLVQLMKNGMPALIFVYACLHAIYVSMYCTYTFVPTHFRKLLPMTILLSAFIVLLF